MSEEYNLTITQEYEEVIKEALENLERDLNKSNSIDDYNRWNSENTDDSYIEERIKSNNKKIRIINELFYSSNLNEDIRKEQEEDDE